MTGPAREGALALPHGVRSLPDSRTVLRAPREGGQASVELAMVLPLVVLLLLAILEMALVARDQVLVVHSAREAARAAAVAPNLAAATKAAVAGSGLSGLQIELVGGPAAGTPITAKVTFAEPGRVPFLRAISSRLTLHAEATMRIEGIVGEIASPTPTTVPSSGSPVPPLGYSSPVP